MHTKEIAPYISGYTHAEWLKNIKTEGIKRIAVIIGSANAFPGLFIPYMNAVKIHIAGIMHKSNIIPVPVSFINSGRR